MDMFHSSLLTGNFTREARETRESREPRPPRAPEAPQERRVTGDERRAEREAAYARNPDQPAVSRPRDASPAVAFPTLPATGYGSRNRGPVPVLLMKRPAREPEKV